MTFSNINYIWIVKLFDSINALSDSCLVDRLHTVVISIGAWGGVTKNGLNW